MYPANRWQGLCSLGTDGVDVMYSGNKWGGCYVFWEQMGWMLCILGIDGRSYIALEQVAGVR